MAPFDPKDLTHPDHPHIAIAAAYALNSFDVVWRAHGTHCFGFHWGPATTAAMEKDHNPLLDQGF